MVVDYGALVEAKKWRAEQEAKQPTIGSALGEVARSAVSTYITGKESEKKNAIEASAEERKTMATFANDLFQNYMPMKAKSPEAIAEAKAKLTPEQAQAAELDPLFNYDPIPAQQFAPLFNYIRKNDGAPPEGVQFFPKYKLDNTFMQKSALNVQKADLTQETNAQKAGAASSLQKQKDDAAMERAKLRASAAASLKALWSSDPTVKEYDSAIRAAKIRFDAAAKLKGEAGITAAKLAQADMLTAAAKQSDYIASKHDVDMSPSQIIEVTTPNTILPEGVLPNVKKVAMTPAQIKMNELVIQYRKQGIKEDVIKAGVIKKGYDPAMFGIK